MLLTPSRTGQPPLDQCYVFQIMLVGVASDVTPQGHTFRPGKALGVDQIFFAGGLYGLFNLRVGAAEIGQDPGERARLTLLVELLVEPVYVLIGRIWAVRGGCLVTRSRTEPIQQDTLPGNDMGDVVFDRPGSVHAGRSHLRLVEGSQGFFQRGVPGTHRIQYTGFVHLFAHGGFSFQVEYSTKSGYN